MKKFNSPNKLAAAVSDFTCDAVNDKIDSSTPLTRINLLPVKWFILIIIFFRNSHVKSHHKVTKMISTLTTEWAPTVNVISFKLETDASLIIKKSAKYFDQGVKARDQYFF